MTTTPSERKKERERESERDGVKEKGKLGNNLHSEKKLRKNNMSIVIMIFH